MSDVDPLDTPSNPPTPGEVGTDLDRPVDYYDPSESTDRPTPAVERLRALLTALDGLLAAGMVDAARSLLAPLLAPPGGTPGVLAS